MPTRLRPIDITNYALNELEPRERLYVESMMFACEKSREDALGLIEVARLLEEGMQAESDALAFALDETRRERIFTSQSQDGLLQNVWRAAAATVAVAACVVFSIAAPQVWNSAMRPIAQQGQIQNQQQVEAANLGAELDTWTTLLQAASVAAFGALEEQPEPVAVPEEFPTRILVPKGTVGMLDVPMPGLGGSDEN
jgi:anti-sigma factor RsiW